MTDALPADLVHSVAVVKELKTKTVRHGGDPDLAPMLELRQGGVLLHIAALDGDRDRTLSLLHDLVVLSDADQAVIIADAYVLAVDEEFPGLGELAERFAAGDPAVRESLNVVSCRANGSTTAVQILYRRRRRRVLWGETAVMEVESGDMARAVQIGFADQVRRRERGPAPPAQEVVNTLGCALLAVQLSPPPRNKPCPCGSGVKAKFCCWA